MNLPAKILTLSQKKLLKKSKYMGSKISVNLMITVQKARKIFE
jgi:hypothetical protein